jgi:hypothetical protein
MKTKKSKPETEYDKIHRELMDYILSGQIHSTLIGKTIMVDHSDKRENLTDVEDFVEYMVSLIKRAEQFGKDNVKKA